MSHSLNIFFPPSALQPYETIHDYSRASALCVDHSLPAAFEGDDAAYIHGSDREADLQLHSTIIRELFLQL